MVESWLSVCLVSLPVSLAWNLYTKLVTNDLGSGSSTSTWWQNISNSYGLWILLYPTLTKSAEFITDFMCDCETPDYARSCEFTAKPLTFFLFLVPSTCNASRLPTTNGASRYTAMLSLVICTVVFICPKVGQCSMLWRFLWHCHFLGKGGSVKPPFLSPTSYKYYRSIPLLIKSRAIALIFGFISAKRIFLNPITLHSNHAPFQR